MHDLVPFAPRPRPATKPTDDIRGLVNRLINDIQVIGSFQRVVILQVLAGYAHDQRVRILKEEQIVIDLLKEPQQQSSS
jgi:hypothetical protein